MLNRRTFRNCCTTLAVALAALAACATSTKADLVAYWNFNSGVSGTPWTFPIASNLPNATAGSITQGTWGSGISSLDAFAGSTINAISPDGAGASLSLIAGTGQSNNNKYVQFQFSMTGFSNLILTFATRGTGTGFSSGLWSYSTDGTNFTQEPSNTNTALTTTTFVLKTVDFSAVTALNNAPTVYLRYTLSGATGASGNNRIDNLQLNATFNPPTGACCNGGSCSTLSQTDCTTGGGTYQGNNSPCSPNPCAGALTGACCNPTTGVCTVTTSANCLSPATYLGDNTVCSPNPCPQPPTGACCNNGVCTVATQFNCTSGGGTYASDGSTCTVDVCGCSLTATSVRALPNGSGVTVCHLKATSLEDQISSATVKSFQAQDTSGTLGVRGVTIFGPNAAVQSLVDQLSVGATFDLYGGTNVFNGLFEIEDTAANHLAIANVNPDTPATPYAITLADMQDGAANAEQLESVLVQTECVTFTNTGTFTSGQNYNITNGTLVAQVRISTPDLPIANTAIPTGPVRLTGILSQNDTTDPRDGNYQLLLRTPADIQVCVQGACCNGVSCSITTQAACVAPGVYQGDNSTCSPSPCTVAATGACCNAQTGACSVTTQAACTGSYQGDNTTCSPNPCPQPATGACCNNGVCTVLTQLQCTTAGGTYTTDGSTCTVGACACFTATSARAVPVSAGITICNLKLTYTFDTIASTTVKSIFAQDTTGTLGVRGITIFGSNAAIDAIIAGVPVGSTFNLYGSTQSFNSLFELEDTVNNPLAFGNVVAGAPATPTNITLAQIQDGAADAEQLESVLVKTECVTFVQTGNFAGGTNYQVTNGTLTAVVRVGTTALPIVGTAIPTGQVKVRGVLSQFDNTAPFDGGYQLLLSDAADIEVCPSVEPCNTCPGNFDGSNTRDGRDIRGFVNCFMSSFGNAPSAGCGCADMNGDAIINLADLNDPTTGFIKVLLTGTACP